MTWMISTSSSVLGLFLEFVVDICKYFNPRLNALKFHFHRFGKLMLIIGRTTNISCMFINASFIIWGGSERRPPPPSMINDSKLLSKILAPSQKCQFYQVSRRSLLSWFFAGYLKAILSVGIMQLFIFYLYQFSVIWSFERWAINKSCGLIIDQWEDGFNLLPTDWSSLYPFISSSPDQFIFRLGPSKQLWIAANSLFRWVTISEKLTFFLRIFTELGFGLFSPYHLVTD